VFARRGLHRELRSQPKASEVLLRVIFAVLMKKTEYGCDHLVIYDNAINVAISNT
jgi:hypothetical protein